jgi:DNA-directed DNA polymerase III PolC
LKSVAAYVPFVELLGRTNFSFLQGASHPDEMVEAAIELGYNGITICDLHGLYGVVQGYKTAKAPSLFKASLHSSQGFSYLIGTEFILTDQSHIALLPMTQIGYTQLCQLITVGKRQATKGFCKLSLTDIKNHNQDLIALALPPTSVDRFESLHEIFGDRLYLPVWRDMTWESRQFLQQALYLEKSHNAQLFVTNRPYMHSPERKPVFDTLTCILHHTTLDEAKTKLLQNSENHLRPIEELLKIWSDRPDLLAATQKIADRIQFDLGQIRYRYPTAQLPAGMSSAEYLKKLTHEGLHWRFPDKIPDSVLKMAQHELTLIADLKYDDYFLTLYEICQFAREKQILYQGRGSAANSVVCFALGLTAVDPTKVDLLFERFISKERDEPPDIDIDFEHQRREEVIQHIYQKYDENHAAMVCTIIRYKSRMALRETAKVFGIPLGTIDRIIKFMGRDGMRRLKETETIFAEFGIDSEKWMMMMAIAQGIYGFPRHVGIHTGGFLITQDFICQMVPVEKATMQGRYVIQWNKDDVNFMGLMKIDLLSLGMLTAIKKSLESLSKHKNLHYNLATLPAEDKTTYDMISRADTVGVFQIESRAQMQTLPRMRPRNFYDLVVEVALIRPGPLQGGMVHPYLRRRQGLEKVQYGHPKLESVLKKTLGVPIFQEQVMKIVMEAASFSAGEADELRRLMSAAWRGKGTMDGVRHRIMRGFKENGIPDDYAEKIYKTIEGFANYGFPESHAASFALLTYASCYLKCHHPEVFTCSLLNSQPMGFYAPRTLIADAQRHGVRVRPLCVQKSDVEYTLVKSDTAVQHNPDAAFKKDLDPKCAAESANRFLDLQIGLCSVYGVAQHFLNILVQERTKNGSFKNLSDLIMRTCLPKSVLLRLAASGAMSSFKIPARELIWQIEATELSDQSFLWTLPRESFQSLTANQTKPESEWQSLHREYTTKGFSIDNHPIKLLRQKSCLSSKDLSKLPNKKRLQIMGLLAFTQRPPTAKGMCFMTLEDEFGFINVVVPPLVYEKCRLVIYNQCLLQISGVLEKKSGVLNVRADHISGLYR